MDRSAAWAVFERAATEVLQVPAARLKPEARLAEDLGADSVDLIELVQVLQDDFAITVDDSELDAVHTVADAFALVERRVVDG